MKNPFRLLPNLFALFAVAGHAALAPTEWQHQQSFNVAAPGLVRVELPPASFDSAGPRQEDLRVIDAASREIALLLDNPPIPTARRIRPADLDVRLEYGATQIKIITGTKDPLAALTLETPDPFFLRAVRVEISDEKANWTTLDQGVPIFRQWGAEKLTLDLGGHTAAFVRVTVSDNRALALPFTGAWLSLAAGPAPALVPVGASITSRDEFAGETVLTLALDGRHLPLAALAFETKEPLFMRRVTVTVREVRDALPGERTIGSGTLYRVALDGAPARAQLELPLDFTPLTRELLVHIHNGDSPPLALEGVRLKRRPVSLLFMAPAAGAYTLLSGNPQATAPHYDLAAFAGEMRTASAAPVIPGSLEDMPDYHPRESLGTAPLPDVPLTGAPLDTKDWSYRKSLQIARLGVQELELDLAALAKSRPDFADLRLLLAGNQIPYVLEQPALARSVTLTPVAAPDPKRPTFSVWQLHLPEAGLPIPRLVLSSGTPLFERQIRIYEKLTGADGRAYDSVLTSEEWHRTPEPGVPETKVLNLFTRARSDTLWIETDNRDNPAIALGAVQVVYPVVRLIFKVVETEGFTLAYGNPAANPPRYDLNLVAMKLLTSGRNVAHVGPGEQSTVSGNPFARLNGGYVFWAALALVVVVLLVVVAKLLPKPPAA
ncbi:MAG TPA: DUF3999 family protein [Lacunisphaera sp.]|nr:DUF3999 family protein [Lacunisphaera sp.]